MAERRVFIIFRTYNVDMSNAKKRALSIEPRRDGNLQAEVKNHLKMDTLRALKFEYEVSTGLP